MIESASRAANKAPIARAATPKNPGATVYRFERSLDDHTWTNAGPAPGWSVLSNRGDFSPQDGSSSFTAQAGTSCTLVVEVTSAVDDASPGEILATDHRTGLAPRSMPSAAPLFLTDGGLETVLIFHHGRELPGFAAFDLLREDGGRALLQNYFREHLEIAAELRTGFTLGAPTWRANPDWGHKLGYDEAALRRANILALQDLRSLRAEFENRVPAIELSGCVGPRGDGYVPGALMSADEAERYHGPQVRLFAGEGADSFAAMTMTHVDEAVGIVRAADAAGIPVTVSFTVETDGCLPSGLPLREAIERTDAETGGTARGFMINCAHPDHFAPVLREEGGWRQRIIGIRANASRLSHAELDGCRELDEGDPGDLARRLRNLRPVLPNLTTIGGCCGTDHRHIRAIGEAFAGA